MANKKISELTAITAANTAADDVFAVVDTSSTETKKISRDELKTAVAQTGAEIKAAYEAEANAFTDAQFTKLAGIETSADVTDTTNVTAAGALMDSEVTNLAQVKAFDSADYATAAQGTTADAALPRTGGAMTGAITTNSTFDGRDVSVDGAKLDGIAAGATAYGDSDVDTHLNTSTAATNEVLSWTGSDYDWIAQSGGGGGAWNLISTTTVTSTVSTVDFTSIGTYKRYVLKWDCTMNATAVVKIQIYDNGTLVTSSDYVMLRGAFASYLAVQTTFSGVLTSAGLNKQIGQLEISAVEPRLPFKMEVGGIVGTGDTGERTFTAGALKSTYSLTSFTGLRFGTTGGNNIDTGRFALYGLSQ